MTEVTIPIDEMLLCEFKKVCTATGCTVEEAFVAFCEKTAELGRLPFELAGDDHVQKTTA